MSKVWFITGAGRGIGQTLVLGFAQQGATVLIHYAHAEQQAQSIRDQIESSGGHAHLVQADLSHPNAAQQLVEKAHAILGPIDIWINNAGASANSRETQGMSDVEKFDRIMALDVRATWLCSRTAAPLMRDGGCIITIGWDHALDGATGLPSQLYAMSKGAIISLTRCLAQEYAPRLRVNCIAPGFVENDWASTLPDASRQRLINKVPMQRWGQPDDILQAALFLASPAASFITGQVIVVDGGEVMR